jgi:hypothetical protein
VAARRIIDLGFVSMVDIEPERPDAHAIALVAHMRTMLSLNPAADRGLAGHRPSTLKLTLFDKRVRQFGSEQLLSPAV